MKSAHKQEHVFQNGIYSGSKDNPFGFVNKSIWIDSRKTFTGISIHALLQLHTSNLGSAETSLRTNNYSIEKHWITNEKTKGQISSVSLWQRQLGLFRMSVAQFTTYRLNQCKLVGRCWMLTHLNWHLIFHVTHCLIWHPFCYRQLGFTRALDQ